MYPFRGNINGSVYSIAEDLPMSIDYFLLANIQATPVVVNVYLIDTFNNYLSIAPANLAINASEMYEGTGRLVMKGQDRILIQSNGSVGYNFTINNIEP